MSPVRASIALDPRRFGRGRVWQLSASDARFSLSDDAKLFATTFMAGFVFVSLLLA